MNGEESVRFDIGQNLLCEEVALGSSDVDTPARIVEGSDIPSLGQQSWKQLFFERDSLVGWHLVENFLVDHVDSSVDVLPSGCRLLFLESQHFSSRIRGNEATVHAAIGGDNDHREISLRFTMSGDKSREVGVGVAIAIHNEQSFCLDIFHSVAQRTTGPQGC